MTPLCTQKLSNTWKKADFGKLQNVAKKLDSLSLSLARMRHNGRLTPSGETPRKNEQNYNGPRGGEVTLTHSVSCVYVSFLVGPDKQKHTLNIR